LGPHFDPRAGNFRPALSDRELNLGCAKGRKLVKMETLAAKQWLYERICLFYLPPA
jgi:hypothetical protein